MTSVSFDGCFGWFHPPAKVLRRRAAVLLCSGLHRDALNAHYSIRLLADEFAAAGFPALRFDYPDSGDSCDRQDLAMPDAGSWATWSRSVHAAADTLRDMADIDRVILCGFRFGALLATTVAAERHDVAGCILLAPVLRGRSYLQQLRIEARLQGGPVSEGPELHFNELSLDAEDIRQISAVDLRKVRFRPGQQVAVFASPGKQLASCVEAWTRSGATVTIADFAGLEPLLHHNEVDECPAGDFSGILAWLTQAVAPDAVGRPLPATPPAAPLRPHGCRETPVQFGPGKALFGMLCEPAQGRDTRAVIIVNTGRYPHAGFARFGVALARRLAASGLASVRMDFAGIGDSPGPSGKEKLRSHMFEVDRSADTSAAIDMLAARGYRDFSLQGVSAGAYHALHAALADPRISTLLLVNLPLFTWREGDTVDFVRWRTSKPKHYLARLVDRELWLKLTRGDLPIAHFLRAQGRQQYENLAAKGARLARRLGLAQLCSFAWRAMATLSARGVGVLYVYAAEDRGYNVFELEFGPNGEWLRDAGYGTVSVMPELDHQLSEPAMGLRVAETMIEFLQTHRAAVPAGSGWVAEAGVALAGAAPAWAK